METEFDAGEVRRAKYTIYINAACCGGWIVINVVAARLLGKPRVYGLSAAALAMILCWTVALYDLRAGRVMRGVLNYVISGLLLLLAMGFFVPEMSLLFVFATFIFLAFGLSYADRLASSAIVGLTLLVASGLLFTSLGLRWTSGIDPNLLRWVNLTGMTMALAIDATSFIGLRKTLQARAERLARAEHRYRVLLENARDAIGIVSPDGIILEANRGWETLLALPREKILGRSVVDFAPKEEQATRQSAFTQAIAQGGGAVPPATLVRGDGKRIRVELSRTIIEVGGERYVLSVGRDVTEHLRLEDQLRQAQKMEAIGRLAGGIAHDFNNLLSVVLSCADLAMAELANESPVFPELEEIKRAGERAAALTRQMLAFSRQQVLEPRVLNLNEVVTNLNKMLTRVLGEDIELRVQVSSELYSIKADPGQIEQVIMNLVVNARDAMPDGGTLTIETANVELDGAYVRDHSDTAMGPHVMLAVSDTGRGMDKATQARIFEPFFTTKPHGKGTGLGLSTVFGIVKQSGGSIFVYSEVGMGTTLKIYLPKAAGTLEQTLAPTPSRKLVHGSETVLLVEDEDKVRSIASLILRRAAYQVIEAREPAEALSVCKQHPEQIHLLLTDVVMPKMNGRQLAERVKALRPTVKVLFMSGYTDDAILRHDVLGSDVAFLQKPFTPDSLTRKVREVLDHGS